jgi:hypothetical protein
MSAEYILSTLGIVVIQIFGILGVMASVYMVGLAIWEKTIPVIDVKIEGNFEDTRPKSGKPTTLKFSFENVGKGFKKSVLHDLRIMIFFPKGFIIQEAERQGQTSTRSFESTLKGIYKDARCIYVPDPFERKPPVISSMIYGETEHCQVKVIAPEQAGNYTIIFDMSSREGCIEQKEITIEIVD